MNRKYLIDAGVNPEDIITNLCEPDERETGWEKERSIYGFDERETWSMDTAFFQWLYERLMMYKEIAPVDLEYHTFEYNGEEKTQLELIDLLLEYLKITLCKSSTWNCTDEEMRKINEIAKIWSIIIFSMWW